MCGQIYIRQPADSEPPRFTPKQANYVCPKCDTRNYGQASRIVPGSQTKCKNCGTAYAIEAKLYLVPIDAQQG